MTSVFQLYGRPLAENTLLPPLRITGDLDGYTAGEAYEGRLQIVDNIGKCVVEIVESDLPPGAYAFVDNFTNEIVLRWPAYSPPEVPASGVPNGDFELGDNGMWRKGAGWTIETGGAESGSYSGTFANQRGISSIESARVPYTPGTTINASCRFQQGASSEGNLVGRILLIWCDKDGNMIPGGEGVSFNGGNLIRSGSNGAWHTSSVTAQSNNSAVRNVAVGFSANRKKQNRLARVDNFTWDHTYSAGTNSDLDFTVKFKLTDSANRIAYWTGIVGEYTLFRTSVLYPLFAMDEVATAAEGVLVRFSVPPQETETMQVAGSCVAFEFKLQLVTYDHGHEDLQIESSCVSLDIRSVLVSVSGDTENMLIESSCVALNIKEQVILNNQDPELLQTSASCVSLEFT